MSRWSAVFLDRDGTLNVKPTAGSYVTCPDKLELLPGAGEAVRRLCDAKVPVYVVTNQRGVARGMMTLSDLNAVHNRLRFLLAQNGATIDGIYSCVHDLGVCECRKPLPGMLQQVVRERRDLELTRCSMIGDAPSDVAAGRAAGCVTIRLGDFRDPIADMSVGSLREAVDWLLS